MAYPQASTEQETAYFRLIGDEANAESLKTLLAGLGDKKSHFLSLVNHDGMTGCHYAVLFDSQECLQILLDNGADPEIGVQSEVAYSNMTALELSVSRRRRDCTAIIKKHLGK